MFGLVIPRFLAHGGALLFGRFESSLRSPEHLDRFQERPKRSDRRATLFRHRLDILQGDWDALWTIHSGASCMLKRVTDALTEVQVAFGVIWMLWTHSFRTLSDFVDWREMDQEFWRRPACCGSRPAGF